MTTLSKGSLKRKLRKISHRPYCVPGELGIEKCFQNPVSECRCRMRCSECTGINLLTSLRSLGTSTLLNHESHLRSNHEPATKHETFSISTHARTTTTLAGAGSLSTGQHPMQQNPVNRQIAGVFLYIIFLCFKGTVSFLRIGKWKTLPIVEKLFGDDSFYTFFNIGVSFLISNIGNTRPVCMRSRHSRAHVVVFG